MNYPEHGVFTQCESSVCDQCGTQQVDVDDLCSAVNQTLLTFISGGFLKASAVMYQSLIVCPVPCSSATPSGSRISSLKLKMDTLNIPFIAVKRAVPAADLLEP